MVEKSKKNEWHRKYCLHGEAGEVDHDQIKIHLYKKAGQL